MPSPVYRFGPHVLDVGEWRLTCDGEPREVQGKVLELLAALLERPGQLWTRDELHARLWPGVFVSEDALFQAVRKARRALDDAPRAPRWIETVAGQGYRFVGATEPAAPPLPRASEPRPALRPMPPATSFTGREALLDALADALAAGGGLWTLTGPGGVGKTRLALELLERVRGQLPGEAVFCTLEAAADRSGVRAAIGRAIGLAAQSLDHAGEIVAELHARGALVLVLDNAEPVADAVAAEIADWPAALPAARIVVTSRARLGLTAERLIDVPPLDLPPADAELAELATYGASRLLLDRARSTAGYQPAASDAAAIAALVARLGGLPLALELAAPRLRLLSPAQLHGRMGRLLDLLVGHSPDRPSRHATLRSAIAASWELLDDAERRALADLSAFAGPFSVEAAEAVVAADDAHEPLELLERLLDQSLVRRGEGASPLQLLPSIRAFAAEQAGPSAEGARGRMAAWYARADAFPGPAHRAAQQANAERASLVAALEHAVQRGDGPIAAAVAQNLCRTLLAHGPLREVAEHLPVVRALPGVPPAARAQLYLREAEAKVDGGGVEEADVLLDAAAPLVADDPAGRAALAWTRMGVLHRRGSVEAALALAQTVLDDPLLTPADRARFLLGRARALVLVHGNSDAANAELRACLELAEALGLPALRGSALYELGLNLLLAGDLRGSRTCLEEGLACARSVGDVMTEAKARARLGRVLVRLSELAEAEDHLAAATRLCRQTGIVESQGVCAESLGMIALQRGDFETALQRYREAVAFHARSGRTHLLAVVRGNLGTLLAQMGRLDEARLELLAALENHRERGRSPGHVLGTLGLIDGRLGDLASARFHFDAAWRTHEAEGNRRSAARAQAGLASVECETGDFAAAEALINRAVPTLRACGDREGLGQALGISAWIAGCAGTPRDHAFDEAEAILGDAGLLGSLGIVRTLRARAALRAGDRPRALALRQASVDATGAVGPELAWYVGKLDAELAREPR